MGIRLNVNEGIFPACYSPDVLVSAEIAKWNQSDDAGVREAQTRAVSFLAGSALVLVGALYNLAAVVVKLPIVAVRLTFGQIPTERGKWADDFPADTELQNLGWHIYKVVFALFDIAIYPIVGLAHPGANIAMHLAMKTAFLPTEEGKELPEPSLDKGPPEAPLDKEPPKAPPPPSFSFKKSPSIFSKTFLEELKEKTEVIENRKGSKTIEEIEAKIRRSQEKMQIWKEVEANVAATLNRKMESEVVRCAATEGPAAGDAVQPDGCSDEEWGEEDEVENQKPIPRMDFVYKYPEGWYSDAVNEKAAEEPDCRPLKGDCGNRVTELLRNGTFGEEANRLQKAAVVELGTGG